MVILEGDNFLLKLVICVQESIHILSVEVTEYHATEHNCTASFQIKAGASTPQKTLILCSRLLYQLRVNVSDSKL